jgi:hypothetical protein
VVALYKKRAVFRSGFQFGERRRNVKSFHGLGAMLFRNAGIIIAIEDDDLVMT